MQIDQLAVGDLYREFDRRAGGEAVVGLDGEGGFTGVAGFGGGRPNRTGIILPDRHWHLFPAGDLQ